MQKSFCFFLHRFVFAFTPVAAAAQNAHEFFFSTYLFVYSLLFSMACLICAIVLCVKIYFQLTLLFVVFGFRPTAAQRIYLHCSCVPRLALKLICAFCFFPTFKQLIIFCTRSFVGSLLNC